MLVHSAGVTGGKELAGRPYVGSERILGWGQGRDNTAIGVPVSESETEEIEAVNSKLSTSTSQIAGCLGSWELEIGS